MEVLEIIEASKRLYGLSNTNPNLKSIQTKQDMVKWGG